MTDDSATLRAAPCRRCSVCEGLEHHWLPDCDEDTGDPVMVCKHCPATRPIADGCDRAEIVMKRSVNCGWITVHDEKQFLANLRIALDTEVEAGGPYLNDRPLQALKEADRLARENAKLRYAKYLGPMDRAECDRIMQHALYKLGDALLVWVNEGDLIAHGVDTAIRASITTDEG